MVIYGVALLAFSMLLGTYLGDLIGVMMLCKTPEDGDCSVNE